MKASFIMHYPDRSFFWMACQYVAERAGLAYEHAC
jgi:hypothetical protein